MTTTAVHKRPFILPTWILRLIGYSSLAAALVTLAIYWYKGRFPRSGSRRSRNSSSEEHRNVQQRQNNPSWFLSGRNRSKNKKMTISLKNTVLWNPSSDVHTPNHAFHENAATVLSRLAQVYDVYVIVHINSDEERRQILELLENAGLTDVLDTRKILVCSTEEGKIHMVRHIEPYIHVEGGWECDDGEDIVQSLRPFVSKLVWVIRRHKDNGKVKEAPDMGANVELTEKLLDTSIAREVGFNNAQQ